MTHETLTARIDEHLARPVRPPVYVEIVDPSGRVSYRRWSDHPDVQEALGTQGYTVRRCPQQPELEGEAHPDRALLTEARAQIAAQAEALARVRGLADTWAREADATFSAFPGDPRAGIRQAGRASELEMRAEALHVALGAQS